MKTTTKIILMTIGIMQLIGCDFNETSLHKICGNFHEKCYAVWNDYYQDPQLTDEFQAERFTKLAENGLVGTCKMGKPTCDEDMNIISCDGAVYPSYPDECNGLDEDCSGEVDDGFYPVRPKYWSYADKPNPCPSGYGVCTNATISCNQGNFVCNLPYDYENPEVSCDRKDNDCDSRIDNLDPKGFCFDGEFWQATQGECHPGLTMCSLGQWECLGQTAPSEEVCDGMDNDCNGIRDDTTDLLATKYDIVFVIDTSGSMCRYITSVAAALNTYVQQFEANPNFRFAIVIMSSPWGSLVVLDTDFTDLGTIRNRLLTLGCAGWGAEASLDSMDMVCDEANPLELSWNDNANRLLFVFTDEYPQSYLVPFTSEQDVIDSCNTSNTRPFIWSRNEPGFVNIVNNTNGIGFEIVDDWMAILDNLNSIVVDLCGR